MKTGREENGNRREGSSVGTGGRVDQRGKRKEEPGKSKEDSEWKGR